MASIDVAFTRALLSQIIPTVQSQGYRPMRDAWVWCAGRDHWEFHGPDKFYWHGNAGNAYEARYKGWTAFLEKLGIEQQRPCRWDKLSGVCFVCGAGPDEPCEWERDTAPA